MNIERLLKALDENGRIQVRWSTMRRLGKYRNKESTFDSILNNLMDCIDFYSDQWDKKR